MKTLQLAALALAGATSLMATTHRFFLGCYTKTGPSQGIYALALEGDTGALSAPALLTKALDPAWVTLSPDKKFLYTIHGSQAQAIGFAVGASAPHFAAGASTGESVGLKLTPLPLSPLAANAANPPSHLVVDATGRTLLAANYRDGFVASMPVARDGMLGTPHLIKHEGKGPNAERQDKPHVHSVTLAPDNRFVIVADLGTDKVHSYALDAAAAKLTPAAQPFAKVDPGAGPRHSKFSRDGKHVYVMTEMGGTVTVFDYDAATGALTPKQTISTLPADFTGLKWNAEVRVHPNGKFLYASNRSHDSITVFAIDPATGTLSLVENVSSGGKTPRNFELTPDGQWLVCAHQDSEDVNVFRVDASSGRLTRTPHSARVAGAVCVLFYD